MLLPQAEVTGCQITCAKWHQEADHNPLSFSHFSPLFGLIRLNRAAKSQSWPEAKRCACPCPYRVVDFNGRSALGHCQTRLAGGKKQRRSRFTGESIGFWFYIWHLVLNTWGSLKMGHSQLDYHDYPLIWIQNTRIFKCPHIVVLVVCHSYINLDFGQFQPHFTEKPTLWLCKPNLSDMDFAKCCSALLCRSGCCFTKLNGDEMHEQTFLSQNSSSDFQWFSLEMIICYVHFFGGI